MDYLLDQKSRFPDRSPALRSVDAIMTFAGSLFCLASMHHLKMCRLRDTLHGRNGWRCCGLFVAALYGEEWGWGSRRRHTPSIAFWVQRSVENLWQFLTRKGILPEGNDCEFSYGQTPLMSHSPHRTHSVIFRKRDEYIVWIFIVDWKCCDINRNVVLPVTTLRPYGCLFKLCLWRYYYCYFEGIS